MKATTERDLAGTCLACGDSVLSANRRNLNTSASKHVVPIWKEIASKELEKRQYGVDLDDLLAGSGDPASRCMCRRCFYAYEKLLGAKAAVPGRKLKADTKNTDPSQSQWAKLQRHLSQTQCHSQPAAAQAS